MMLSKLRLSLCVAAFGLCLVEIDAHEPQATEIPSIIIGKDSDGKNVSLPMIGAGTWQYNDTIAYESVCKAFEAGYTFVDTAFGKFFTIRIK